MPSIQGGHYGPFFNLRLPPYFLVKPFKPIIDEFRPLVFPEHPQIGNLVILECFAYGRYYI